MFDTDSHHCWNSDQVGCWLQCSFVSLTKMQGSPQSILLSFEREVLIQKLCLAFQGGFVGQVCEWYCMVFVCDAHSGL